MYVCKTGFIKRRRNSLAKAIVYPAPRSFLSAAHQTRKQSHDDRSDYGCINREVENIHHTHTRGKNETSAITRTLIYILTKFIHTRVSPYGSSRV